MKRIIAGILLALAVAAPVSAARYPGNVSPSRDMVTTAESFYFTVWAVPRAESVRLVCDNGYTTTVGIRPPAVFGDEVPRTYDFSGSAVGQAGGFPIHCVGTAIRTNGSSSKVSAPIIVIPG